MPIMILRAAASVGCLALRIRTCISRLAVPCVLLGTAPLTGCFNERSFAMRPGDLSPVTALAAGYDATLTTVAWLEATHAALRPLLPDSGSTPLLTGAMRAADGVPIDVPKHFRLPTNLSSIFTNLTGLLNSAQVMGSDNRLVGGPDWSDFEDVWIAVDDQVSLAGRLIRARSGGEILRRDCIVILPGLLGDNDIQRTRDLAVALNQIGLHALAVEPRGYGRTGERYPDVLYTYGLRDPGDLMTVSQWLQSKTWVRDTGLIGFSWGANVALLTAWEDGRRLDDTAVSNELQSLLRIPNGREHYRAGVLAFSPVIRFERLLDKLERNWSMLQDPVLNRLQAGVRDRSRNRLRADGNGDLRALIRTETQRAGFDFPDVERDGMAYLRLLSPNAEEAAEKLEAARIPVLIVKAANDPLSSAQDVADLLSRLRNPRVAGIILPGGGHNGFSAYARVYYYNLVLRFFGDGPGSGPVDSAGLVAKVRTE